MKLEFIQSLAMKKIFLLAILCCQALFLYSQLPKTISFQGYLTNDQGEPITATGNDKLPVSFSLFDQVSEGNRVWGPEQQDIEVNLGIFSTILGSVEPMNVNSGLSFDKTYFLQITIDPEGTPEVLERIRLTSSAYSLSTVNALNVTFNELSVAQGGTGGSNASTARTNLGLAIGSDVQAYDADLDDLADGTLTATKIGDGIEASKITVGSLAVANGGTGATSASNARSNLGLGIGSDVQAYDADLDDLADGSLSPSKIGDGLDASIITVGSLAVANGGTGSTTASDARTTLGLAIGTNVQAYDTDLDDLADGTLSGSKIGTGIDATNITVSSLPVTNGGTGATTESGARTNLGLVIGTDIQAFDDDLTDLADGTLTGSKVGTGVDAENITINSLAIANGGTAATSAGDARTNLGLEIGTNVQAYDAGLASIAGLTTSADKMIYTTTSDTYAATNLTSFGRSIIDDASASEFRTTAGLVIGTNVQAQNDALESIGGLTTVADKFIYTTDVDVYATSDVTSFGRGLLANTSLSNFKSSLDLETGVDLQAWDDDLDDISALSATNGGFLVGDGTDWTVESGSTARASLGLTVGSDIQAHDDDLDTYAGITPSSDVQTMLGSSNNSNIRSNIGLAIGTNVQAYDADLTDLADGTIEVSSGLVGIGITPSISALEVNSTGTGFVTILNHNNSTGTGLVLFQDEGSNIGSITHNGAGVITYGTFTGAHMAVSTDILQPDELVSLSGKYDFYGIPGGEPLYHVSKTSKPNSAEVLGSYSHKLDEEEVLVIAAVGNGSVWVVDNGSDLKVGDYLITSEVAGHGMKDLGDFPIANIIARVAENVNWGSVNETINGRKHKRVSIFYESFTIDHTSKQLRKEIEQLRNELEQLKELITN